MAQTAQTTRRPSVATRTRRTQFLTSGMMDFVIRQLSHRQTNSFAKLFANQRIGKLDPKHTDEEKDNKQKDANKAEK